MKKLIYIFLSSIILFGCDDKVLDLNDPNNYTEDTYFKVTDEFTKSVNAIYGGYYFMFNREYYFIFDLAGNDAEKASALQAPLPEFSSCTFDKTNMYVNRLWRSLYRMVLRANLAEAKIDMWDPKEENDKELKTRLLGEARYLRAWSYFKLVSLWGRVPLRKSWEDRTIQHMKRSSVADIYAFIETDLKDAVGKLPVSYDDGNIGRATKGAATALLGKVYLYQEKYSDAESELKKLDGATYSYSLVADYQANFVESGDNNSESIFEVQHGWNEGDNFWYMFGDSGGEETWGAGATHTGRSKEYDFTSWNNVKVAPKGAESFTYKDESNADYTDPRAAMVFYSSVALGGDTDFKGGAYDAAANGISWKKYQNLETIDEEPNPSSAINSKIIRFSDVLLMWAEALIKQNKISDAMPIINRVRARVGAFQYTSLGTQTEAMDKLKLERRMELYGEQQRWFDIVRWGDMSVLENEKKSVYGASFTIDNKYYLFPIPENEVDYNTEVAGDLNNDWN